MALDQSATLALRESSRDVSPATVIELILERVRLRARRRLAWLDHLAGDENGYQASIACALDYRDTPENEAAWQQSAASAQQLNRNIVQLEAVLAGDAGIPMQHLAQLFSLSESEQDLLVTCLAIAVDPALATVFARLQGHEKRGYATDILVARLFGHGRIPLWAPGGPLAVWQLVTEDEAPSGEPAPLSIDRLLIGWIQGELQSDPALIGLIQVVEPQDPLPSWPVVETVQYIQRSHERGTPTRLIVSAPAGSGRRSFAAAIASRLGVRVLAIDTSSIAENDWPAIYVRAQRLASLSNSALIWYGEHVGRKWPRQVAPGALQFIASDHRQEIANSDFAIDQRIELPTPDEDERRQLWLSAWSEATVWPDEELQALVSRYRLSPGDITNIARRAPRSVTEASLFAREATRDYLGNLGQLIDCPFTWDDLVVPDKLLDALGDFSYEAQERARFWESARSQRLFPRGTGLVALFNGPPGTGKTMTAQIIAAELQLDLFRIDLATVISKYIGETAKHLGQIFSRAARMNAVLLFDEADALFTKRTEIKDAHDRYANADTSYLLQQLEEYRGIAILASNKKQNIDPAFVRRIRYAFEFTRPDAEGRYAIWRRVITELTDSETCSRLDQTINNLARAIDLSGAQIKNAGLAAIFVSRRADQPLAIEHLVRSIERELNKDGRALTASERQRLT